MKDTMTVWRNYKQNPGNESKYHAEKVTIDGETFDSRREARRWTDLRLLERAGEIRDLRRQVKYILIPTQREEPIITKTGKEKPGRVIEKECSYLADFVYQDARTGETIVEDAKGFRTEVYRIKKKLMLYVHGIRVTEV